MLFKPRLSKLGPSFWELTAAEQAVIENERRRYLAREESRSFPSLYHRNLNGGK